MAVARAMRHNAISRSTNARQGLFCKGFTMQQYEVKHIESDGTLLCEWSIDEGGYDTCNSAGEWSIKHETVSTHNGVTEGTGEFSEYVLCTAHLMFEVAQVQNG